jgi:hypothetical protein
VNTFDILEKIYPLVLGFITVVIVLARMDNKISVLEEKVRSLFDLWNKSK